MLDFLLGLPYLREGPLWETARRLNALVLVGANALSLWRREAVGLRVWSGFDRRMLHLVEQHPIALDSGGFVASVVYRGSPFTVTQYMELSRPLAVLRFPAVRKDPNGLRTFWFVQTQLQSRQSSFGI